MRDHLDRLGPLAQREVLGGVADAAGTDEKMQEADMVLFELLRVAHPFPILERVLDRDLTFGERTLKKGTTVVIENDRKRGAEDAWTKWDHQRWQKLVAKGRDYA